MNRRGQSGNSFVITSFSIAGLPRGRFRRGSFARWRVALAVALLAFACPLAAKAASPAEMISSFRHQHGEGKAPRYFSADEEEDQQGHEHRQ